MKMNGSNGLALILIAFGVLIILGKLGFILGPLMGYLIPIAMVALGYFGIRNGSRFWGWLILTVGSFALIGKFAGIIGFLVGIGLIVYGASLFKKRPGVY
ncbi:hypothetical protein [Ferviditalea candida]|uniref:Uncharacterized protein n=1 Tax=Ferviditalea candida TaxID=3108399 RepID=A0ABU5ZIY9_9BACL|nr:hypothetical protein [Paenibacillaceae bacterium T2]